METKRQKRWREFWEMVDLARENRTRFYEKLRGMDQDDLAELYYTYETNIAELKDDVFIEQMGKHLSEDSIDDAAIWILSHGEEYFLDILEHPEKIPDTIIKDSGIILFDARGAIIEVYEDRFGEPIFKRQRHQHD